MQTQQSMFDVKPLLRPHQAEEAKSEIKALEQKLQSPTIEDKGEVRRQLQRMSKTVNDQLPIPPQSAEEEGRMESRSKDLLNQILDGMPSQEEMRKAPPGAVDKHMKWEAANKMRILEWKNIQLRTKPGERESANLERYRPKDSTLNMDNAYIPGKQIYIPDAVGRTVTFSDEQMAALRAISPQIADMLGTMANKERAEVKQALAGGIGLATEPREPSAASIYGKFGVEKREATRKIKRSMSEEQKAKIRAGREAYWAKKKAA